MGKPFLPQLLFVSYSTKDEIQVQKLCEELRKSHLQVYAYPFDVPDGSNIVEGIRAQSQGNFALALAMSSNNILHPWIRREIDKELIASFNIPPRNIYVLKLSALSARQLADLSFVADAHVIDLAGDAYGDGVARLLRRLIPSPAKTLPPVMRAPAPFKMTASFEPARPATELFHELRRQIDRGSINQKYLYWDVRAVLRWQRIAELSGYMTVQMAMNLLTVHAKDVAQAVAADAGTDKVSFINLGVGTGVKDYLLLIELLERFQRVTYFAMDESFPMIQLTMQTLEELMSQAHGALSAHYLVDDLLNLEMYEAIVADEEQDVQPRLIGLDNMIGNFNESQILPVVRNFMRPDDYLLMGVEFIAGRDDDELIRNYSDRRMKEFLFGPISDATGTEPDWQQDFSYDVVPARRLGRYSAVPDARTVKGSVRFNNHTIDLFFSTKYEPEQLERYLVESAGFETVATFVSQEPSPRYGMFLLKQSS